MGAEGVGDGWTGGGWLASRGPVSGCRLLFSAVAKLACKAIGLEKEKRNVQCSADYMMVGTNDVAKDVVVALRGGARRYPYPACTSLAQK